MFNATDITIIIQGGYFEGVTEQVMVSAKKYFPESAIIFSTTDERVKNKKFAVDELIVSPKPEVFSYPQLKGEKDNNVNCQIVSTFAGLKKVKTKYALKLRSDFVLTGADFLQYFEKFPAVEKNYKVFSHKILACCFFSRNPNLENPFPFHPSDLAFFGRTNDLLKLFDVELMNKKEAYYNKKAKHWNRYFPEQYIFINCLKKNGYAVNCDFYDDSNPKAIEQTEHYFASNFVFLDFEQFNLNPTKDTFSLKKYPLNFGSCYTHNEWLELYKKYVDENIKLPQKDEVREFLNNAQARYKKLRRIANIMALICFFNRNQRKKLRKRILDFLINL